MKFLLLLSLTAFTVPQEHDPLIHDTGLLSFELLKNKIIIPVQIGGKSFRFLLDTGGILEVSAALQDQFKFPIEKSTTIVDINKKELEIETVKVPEIKLGAWTFSNRKAIVSDLHDVYPYRCFDLDGMIGRDFINGNILHLDHSSHTFRLTQDINSLNIDKTHRAKLKLTRRGLPAIKLEIDGKNKFIEFDSGSGDFYSPKSSDIVKRLKRNPHPDILSFVGEFSFGITMDNISTSTRYMQHIERLQLGGTNFSNFYSQFSKVSAPRIGAAILHHGAITLDYQNGWLYYQPFDVSPTLQPFSTFGFDIKIENGRCLVKYVLEGSAAQKAGITHQTQILAINDQSFANPGADCEGYLHGYLFSKKKHITVHYLAVDGEKVLLELDRVEM